MPACPDKVRAAAAQASTIRSRDEARNSPSRIARPVVPQKQEWIQPKKNGSTRVLDPARRPSRPVGAERVAAYGGGCAKRDAGKGSAVSRSSFSASLRSGSGGTEHPREIRP